MAAPPRVPPGCAGVSPAGGPHGPRRHFSVTDTDTGTDTDTATVTGTRTVPVTDPIPVTRTAERRLFWTTRYNILMRRESDRIAELTREIETNPHSRQFYQLGELLRRDGRAEEAAAVLRRGLQFWPRYVAAWVSLARAELERRAAEGACGALEKALELDPENPVAWRLLAEAEELAGRLERALAAMRRATALVPGDETLLEALHRLEVVAAAPAPPPAPPGAEAATSLEVAAADEGVDLEETVAMPVRAQPLPEPFAAPAARPAGPEPAEERPAAAVSVEPFAVGEAQPEEASQLEPQGMVATEPPTVAQAPVFAEAEPAVFAQMPQEAIAEAPQVFAEAPPETSAEVQRPLFAEAQSEVFTEALPAAPPPPSAAAPAAAERVSLTAPFEEVSSLAPSGTGVTPELAGDVFALDTPIAAAALEDVFGAPQEAPPAAAIEPEPFVESAPFVEAPALAEPPPAAVEELAPVEPRCAIEPQPAIEPEPAIEPPPAVQEEAAVPLQMPEEFSPWATVVRVVLPIPQPPPAEPPAMPAAPGAAAQPPEVAEPEASVEAARALLHAERLREAAAMLERVVQEHGEDGEAKELLELVRDMLEEPMPVELPPLSPRERKIAALQRWLASLTLARERTAL